MRIVRYVIFCSTLFLMQNCSDYDEVLSENEMFSEANELTSKLTLQELPIVYGVIFSESSCTNGYRYNYYATSTDIVDYDRYVYSIAKRGDATIILPVRTIPANQNVSAATGVFINQTAKIGNISIQAQQIFRNNISNDVSNQYERPFLDIFVDNCVSKNISPGPNPCNLDSNDNGTPDCFEFDFETN